MEKPTLLVYRKLDFSELTLNLVSITGSRRNLRPQLTPLLTLVIRIISVTERMILNTDLKVDEVIESEAHVGNKTISF